VGVSQLVRSEPAAHPGERGGVVQLHPDARWRARPSAGRPAQHTEQRSDW
jgi:hypothetical protein